MYVCVCMCQTRERVRKQSGLLSSWTKVEINSLNNFRCVLNSLGLKIFTYLLDLNELQA
jgi:hypothetical protein